MARILIMLVALIALLALGMGWLRADLFYAIVVACVGALVAVMAAGRIDKNRLRDRHRPHDGESR